MKTPIHRSFWQWLFPLAAAAGLATLFLLRRRIGKGPFVALVHDYLATSGLILLVVTYMTRYSFVSDHWQYYGAMSVAALLGAALARFLAASTAGRAAVAGILLALAALTWRQPLAYHDVEALFQSTLEKSPRAWMCLANLGVLKSAQGRSQEALALFDRALAINPDNEETFSNRGSAYLQLGDFRHAVDDCTRAITLWPELTQAYATRAMAYANLGKLELSVADLTRAVELKPDFAEAYANRGVFNLSAGKPDLAIADQTRSLELQPSPRAYRNRALTYARIGRHDDALRDLDQAIAMDGGYVEAYRDRAKSLFRLGRDARARADMAKLGALGAAPDPELLALASR